MGREFPSLLSPTGVLIGSPGERGPSRRSSVAIAFVLRCELLFMLLFAEEICVSANFCADELNLIDRTERRATLERSSRSYVE